MPSSAQTSFAFHLTESSEGESLSSAIPSLIKWTGAKRAIASDIFKMVPPHKRYFEPFLGGGALLYLVHTRPAIVGDIYQPLVQLWQEVQMRPALVAQRYEDEWKRLQESFPDHFYFVRSRFNKNPNPFDLIFLSRTCVNGIIRFNATGQFNNSLHVTRRGMQPTRFERSVWLWHERLLDITIRCCDYEELLAQAGEGDFCYLDPPYAGSTNRYTQDLDFSRMCNVLTGLNERGVKWMLSFDGQRGEEDLRRPLPKDIYTRHTWLDAGHSRVKRVLDQSLQQVRESLYLNF